MDGRELLIETLLSNKRISVIQEQILHIGELATVQTEQDLPCKRVMGRQLGHTYQHYGEYDSVDSSYAGYFPNRADEIKEPAALCPSIIQGEVFQEKNHSSTFPI